MSGLVFTSPLLLIALAALPAIWWLLRITPPRPDREIFPPLAILASVIKREESPATSPWWLTLLRILLAALVILALSGPLLNPSTNLVSTPGTLVVLIDNDWSSVSDWDKRMTTAERLIEEAGDADLPVSLLATAEEKPDATPMSARDAATRLAAIRPVPLKVDRARALDALETALAGQAIGTIAYVSNGHAQTANEPALVRLAALKPANLVMMSGQADPVMITDLANGADDMVVTAHRLITGSPSEMSVTARDTLGRPVASANLAFKAGENEASAQLVAPFELRNEFARIEIDNHLSAGSVRLLDDSFKRRRVGLLSGETGDRSQPLLSPLYYIDRALGPYANLERAESQDFSVAIPALIANNPSVIVMADIGRLPAEAEKALLAWIEKGGTLIRFAGPRLATASADDPLIPVKLRQGERALGGAMSWSEPQALAAYPATGPFAGLDAPAGILVKRQVMAEPSPDLAANTWANLADGTPLVTASRRSAGRIVLFHVSAEAGWSNLPLSGHFVEMLRRIVQLSRATGPSASQTDGKSVLPALKLLTADGTLTTDRATARPLTLVTGIKPVVSHDNPPGLYGTDDGFVALNLMSAEDRMTPLDLSALTIPVRQVALAGSDALSLKPALFLSAFILLLADTLIVLFLNGAFAGTSRLMRPAAKTGGSLAVLALLLAFGLASPAGQAHAADDKPGDEVLLERLDTTHLAFVKTGEEEVDRISERGMRGLSDFLYYRTTLEPGVPVGVNIDDDELSVFPILYWPVSATAPMPSAAAISRIDAYMRTGGTVLFDTRDQFSGDTLDGTISANTQRLQEILASIDVPPLEPVPSDHVLTKSFYLLKTFPGRYAGSPLWVEAQPDKTVRENRPVSDGDGVSPIIITGNDFAGAWAIDDNGAPLLPTVPVDEAQREFAYRTGVNIMMYMLTGNYKADQVHVPALLERLGQ